MINPLQKLNPKILDKACEQIPIRKGFGEGLLLAGEKDSRVVGLCADLTESTQMHLFRNKFPDRFIEVGIAEQNLASLASGMAAMGKLPFITSYAMFNPGRNWEQIRTTICYNNRKVIIIGSHAGISVGPDGGTHQAIEDIALTRVVPNITVISPCDSIEAKKATLAVISDEIKTPVYIRLAREKTPVMTTEDTPFEIGKAQVFFESKNKKADGTIDVAIIATGALVHKALVVANKLESEGLAVKVLNISTIKPLDNESVVASAREAGAIVTVEEHQVAGGLGSSVSEVLVQYYPVPMEFVGIRDQFGQSGTPEELIKHYGLDEVAIEDAIRRVIKRK